MPIINIQLLEGRPEEKIKEVIRHVTDAVVETLQAPRESVRVIVHEVPKSHWGVGGVTKDMPSK